MTDTKKSEQTFIEHILELKDRLLHSVLAIFIVFICIFPFANDVYEFIAAPLLNILPESTNLISVGIISPFLTPLKMALTFAMYIAMPYIFYQIWIFIAPALYRHEKKFIIPLTISTAILFYSGVLFSFYIVLPVIFGFLVAAGPSIVNFSPDIQHYLDFLLKVSFAFGIAFEVPIATIILIKFKMATVEGLRRNRSYVIIGAFILGMLLTPPDIISQTMIAVPMWLLFEVGLFIAPKIVNIKPDDHEIAGDGDDIDDVDDVVEDTDSDDEDDDDTPKAKTKSATGNTKPDNEWNDDPDDFDDDDFDDISDWDGKVTR